MSKPIDRSSLPVRKFTFRRWNVYFREPVNSHTPGEYFATLGGHKLGVGLTPNDIRAKIDAFEEANPLVSQVHRLMRERKRFSDGLNARTRLNDKQGQLIMALRQQVQELGGVPITMGQLAVGDEGGC